MKYLSYYVLIILFSFCNIVIAQNNVSCNEVYIQDKMLHKISNDSLYTGIYERRRHNGHLVYEEHFKNGIIISALEYYNGKVKIVSDSVIYNPKKPFKRLQEYRFNLKSEIISKKSYNDDGKLILKESYENGKLIYSCEYNGRKKHGKEFCYSKTDEPIIIKYSNGKRVKTPVILIKI